MAESLKDERKPEIHVEGRDEAEFALVVLDDCGVFLREAEAGRRGAMRWSVHRVRGSKDRPRKHGAAVRWAKGAYAGVGFGKASEFTLVARADGRLQREDADTVALEEAAEAEGEKRAPIRLRVARVRVIIAR